MDDSSAFHWNIYQAAKVFDDVINGRLRVRRVLGGR
jgi:hypothetical protein